MKPRIAFCLALAIGWAAILAPSAGLAADKPKLHRIDIKTDPHPKAYHPHIGDLVQCYLNYPIVPGQIVDKLKVTLEGSSIALVAVVDTTRPRTMGACQWSAFLAPREGGLSHLTVVPVCEGKDGTPVKINFYVELPAKAK